VVVDGLRMLLTTRLRTELTTEDEYPYTAYKGTCDFSKEDKVAEVQGTNTYYMDGE
jgi:hypothetical protein